VGTDFLALSGCVNISRKAGCARRRPLTEANYLEMDAPGVAAVLKPV